MTVGANPSVSAWHTNPLEISTLRPSSVRKSPIPGKYIDDLDVNLDKTKLKGDISKLYHEAQDLEL